MSSPESRSAPNCSVVFFANGLSPFVMSLQEVVMYRAHVTGPMTAGPSCSPSRRASVLRAWTPRLELDIPLQDSADAAWASLRCASTYSAALMPKSAAACFTFWAPPAMFIPMPSGRPVLFENKTSYSRTKASYSRTIRRFENTPKTAARAALAAALARPARRRASCAAATRNGSHDHSSIKSSKVVTKLPARINAAKNEA